MMDMQSGQRLAVEVMKQTQDSMLEQLGNLIKSGALVWESGEPALVRSAYTDKFCVMNLGRFRLREQEAFDALKKENAHLKAKLAAIENALG